MRVGTGTRLQARKLPADSDQQAVIASKFESVRAKIATWQRVIDKDTITLEGIKAEYDELKGSIHSLYQDAL